MSSFWMLSDEQFLEILKRVNNGEDPDEVYSELYTNSDIETVEEVER